MRTKEGCCICDMSKVYKEYSNEHLLVMSYVDGIQIDHIEELDRNGYDRKEIAQKTAQTIVNRFWRMVFFMQITSRESMDQWWSDRMA